MLFVRCYLLIAMVMKPIEEKTLWENFATSQPLTNLLQSWAFGEFAKKQGRKVFRLGFYKNGKLFGVAQLIQIIAKRGNYLECQGGPVTSWADSKLSSGILKLLKEFSKQKGVDFLRLRVPLTHDPHLVQQLQASGFKLAPMYFPAEHTLVLDLTQTKKQLLANMRKNTRYGIRRAQREGVSIHLHSTKLNPKGLTKALQSFFQLYQQTIKRQDFIGYNYQYFQDQVEAFAQDNQVLIVLAEHQSKVVAGAIIFFYSDTAYYLHGASIPTQPDVYASHAVQWAAIREAKRCDYKKYDFWGVAPPLASGNWDEQHPRAGITLFKRGFGGEYFRHMPTMDLPLSWRYWLTYTYVKLERWRREL